MEKASLVASEGPMDVLTFVASMTGSLAWPIAAFVIAFLFKGQIRALIERLNEVGFGDAKATFSRKLDAAERSAEGLPPPAQLPENVAEDIEERLGGTALDEDGVRLAYQEMILKRYSDLGVESGRFAALLDIAPSAAVLETYTVVERALYRLAERKSLDVSLSRLTPTLLANRLRRENVIPNDIVHLMNQLREMRNRAAHGADISITDAVRFREIATKVTAALWNAAHDIQDR